MNDHNEAQKAHYSRQYAQESVSMEMKNDDSLWEWCRWYPLMVLDEFIETLRGLSCITICAGAGRELGILSRHGIKITATDLAVGQLLPLKEAGIIADVQEQDAEKLTYQGECFDYGFVNAGLHHLAHPHAGLCELLRCARHGVIFIEAHDSPLHAITRILGRRSADFEPAGNYVYRWKKRELEKISLSAHAHSYAVTTAFVPIFTKTRHVNGFAKNLGIRLFNLSNLMLSPVGNVFIGIIFKQAPTSKQVSILKRTFSKYQVLNYPQFT